MNPAKRCGTALLSAALVLLAACPKQPANVNLKVRVTGDERRGPMRNPGSATTRACDVDVFKLEVYDPASGASAQAEVTNDFTIADSIAAGALDVAAGKGWHAQLTGIDRDGALWAMGRSVAFEVPEKGEGQATLVLGIADDFSLSARVQNGLGPFPSASALPDGRVLLVGLGGAWLHDPATGTLCQDCLTGDLPGPRFLHAAVSIADGKVFLAGGLDTTGTVLAEAFLFDPTSLAFTKLAVPGLPARAAMGAAALSNGSVLLAGGLAPAGEDGARVILVDPGAATLTEAAPLAAAVRFPTATALADGSVLVAGGLATSGEPVATTALYAADGSSAKPGAALRTARGGHTATLQGDGDVLVFGGRGAAGAALAKPEAYVPATDKFLEVAGADALSPRVGHAALRLDAGEVLIVGGEADPDGPVDPGRLVQGLRFNPVGEAAGSYIGAFEPVGQVLARSGAALVALPDASVLVAGGARPALGANPAAVPVAADWTGNLELYVPCAVQGRACPR